MNLKESPNSTGLYEGIKEALVLSGCYQPKPTLSESEPSSLRSQKAPFKAFDFEEQLGHDSLDTPTLPCEGRVPF